MRFESRKGLEIVKRDLQLFYEYFGRVPTQFDFAYVMQLLDYNCWKKYDIMTWEDLIKYSFPSNKLHENENSS